MMDELDLLKKDWQSREKELPRLSFDEIHEMTWKKSSSLVKWIFVISIVEFLIPHLLFLLPAVREDNHQYAAQLGIDQVLLILTVAQYVVWFYFLVQVYRRYREISALDSAKGLMDKILRTRRTVKHYVIFCLSMVLVLFMVFIVGVYLSDDLVAALDLRGEVLEMEPLQLKWAVMGILAVGGVLFTALAGLIYFLMYGLITRKLKANYQELSQLKD